jgi:tight adherence protein C
MKNGFIIFILLFATVFLFLFGIYLYAQIFKEKKGFKKRLEVIESEGEGQIGEKDAPAEENRFRHFLGSLGKFLAPKKEVNISDMRKLFVRAGYRKPGALPLFFGLKVFLALFFFGATLLAKLFFWEWMAPDIFAYISISLAVLGFYLPNLWIKLRISSRKDKIQRGLPDALDLMVVCVEAGTGMEAALSRTAEEMKKTNSILAEELGLVNLEIRAGKPRQEALKNLAWRTDLEDIGNLTTLLIQTERFGTSIAQALRVHSDFMRTKRFQRAEELAQKMPIKLIFPLALFILPMFFLITLGPAMFTIMKHLGNK